ncbi:TetR/AcrR family transcriptional regulator [Rhodococcus sp. D2-41]|uniref:TetR/AcrR family transcriptional regulator n=1 Tax=Speluncibacter jeojiensis TaxID=2710754 RepID=UPI00240E9E3E|nr:TetR/AcrR family transcriptional regulator [Rhodococcus sp. D2-41]MDG3010477.1 TetR/AcrR family transcriptional regulator [Rhodococcus sp. D2-41]
MKPVCVSDEDGSTSADPPRRRDASATREALLNAARALIGQHGVDAVSTRDIAASVSVNQALVYRYFGSKDNLIAEALGGIPSSLPTAIANAPLSDLPRVLLAHVLDVSARSGDQATALSTLAASASNEAMRPLIRARIESAITTHVAARLDGPDAKLRAELIVALTVGIVIMRDKIATPAIAAVDHGALENYVDRMAAVLLECPSGSETGAAQG